MSSFVDDEQYEQLIIVAREDDYAEIEALLSTVFYEAELRGLAEDNVAVAETYWIFLDVCATHAAPRCFHFSLMASEGRVDINRAPTQLRLANGGETVVTNYAGLFSALVTGWESGWAWGAPEQDKRNLKMMAREAYFNFGWRPSEEHPVLTFIRGPFPLRLGWKLDVSRVDWTGGFR